MDYVESDVEFIRKKLIRIFNSEFFILLLFVLLSLQISWVYIGIKNLMNCPIQPKIPIYLFVFGAFGLVKIVNVFYELWRRRKIDNFEQSEIMSVSRFDHQVNASRDIDSNDTQLVDRVITGFLVVWFLMGNYWTFSIWKPNFHQPPEIDSHKWCSEKVYMSSFSQIIIIYSFCLFFLLFLFILLILSRLESLREMMKLNHEDVSNSQIQNY
ncbi:peptidyl-prolyl cis-trans isomerase CYP63-like isoform X1 [Brachionus plicatilis]|uniref:Peptidyl-prolyl cis-trans isomerase CYP63-like isoform X1 n=1 Tax=Brachionus plicatilis TaxID=10195 RepID=A0A3M7PD19_BRAPC|nr:peptidyl-prolyl cis-trans isomerase CYP63-like isoform X1 [Brachionus plicatilis]